MCTTAIPFDIFALTMLLIFLLTFFLFIVLYYCFVYHYWKRRNVKSLQPSFLLGNLTDVVFNRVPTYSTFKKAYQTCIKNKEDFLGFYFFTKPGLVVVDQNLIKCILIKDFENFIDRPFYKNKKIDPLSENVASLTGEEWKKRRDKLTPAFSPSKIKIMSETLLHVTDRMKTVLDEVAENKDAINFSDFTNKFVTDAVSLLIFGVESNSMNDANDEFNSYIQKIAGGSVMQNFKVFLCLMCPKVLELIRIPFFTPDVQKFFLDLVKTTVDYRKKKNLVRKDLMHELIQIQIDSNIKEDKNDSEMKSDSDLKTLQIENIAADSVILFSAAFETTCSAIIFCVYELLKNPIIMEKLKNEITETLSLNNSKISYDVIVKMEYLEKCVSETLRKYPGLTTTARGCSKSYKLPNSDIVIEKGTIVYIPIMEIHNDPQFYPDPEVFDPERFSPEIKSKRPSTTYIPYGDGPRNCLGLRFGQLLAKVFVVTLFKNYNVTLSSKNKLPMKLISGSLILGFEKPVYLNLDKI